MRDDGSGAILANLVYGLGLVGNDVLLRRIRDSDVPQTARQAATWWLNIRTTVRRSARM